jgi:hypothetical protein
MSRSGGRTTRNALYGPAVGRFASVTAAARPIGGSHRGSGHRELVDERDYDQFMSARRGTAYIAART